MTRHSSPTDIRALADRLRKSIRGDVLEDEPMSRHTTIGIGGPADIFVRVVSREDLRTVLAACRESDAPVSLLGGGSNVLVSDLGVRGVVLQLAGEFCELRFEGCQCVAGGAVGISKAISETTRRGLAGLEVLYGIPGSIGGAVFMNAGTKYGWVSHSMLEACIMEQDGSECVWQPTEMEFSYRHSALQERQGLAVVTFARFGLRPEPPESIKARIEEMSRARRDTQPVNWRSCGCMFRNPESDSAGRLIDSAGLKGLSVGGAAVSDRHANFIVTSDGASASDVLRLARSVQRKVQEKHGLVLQLEVRLIGEWPDESS